MKKRRIGQLHVIEGYDSTPPFNSHALVAISGIIVWVFVCDGRHFAFRCSMVSS